MRDGSLAPMGGAGEIVEIGETFYGFVVGATVKTRHTGTQFHNCVLTLVQRGGSARSFHIAGQALEKYLHRYLAEFDFRYKQPRCARDR